MKTEKQIKREKIKKEIVRTGYSFHGSLVYSYKIVTETFYMYQKVHIVYGSSDRKVGYLSGRKVAYLEKFGINEFADWLIENADSYLPAE